MNKSGLVWLLAMIGWLAAAPQPAQSHPHVWIEMTTAVGFNTQGKVDALGIAWTFDEFYSLAAVDGLDKNKDKKFDAAEMKELADLYLKNLEKFRYFTAVEIDAKAGSVGKATAPLAVYSGGRLTFSFRLPLTTPVDPKTSRISFSSFDSTYYIDIQPAKTGAVVFSKNAPGNCGFKQRQSDGPEPPMALNLNQSLKQPPPADGIFGMLPVAIIDIRCAAGSVP